MIRERYEPLGVVGRGAQGEVLRALDHQHDRIVALKVRAVASADERAALLSEARILLAVRPHPNLPLVREDFFDGDRYVMVMDWVEGSPLSAEHGFGHVVSALADVASALDHLHAQGVAHRDVKPNNILVDTEGRAVLVDMGIAASAGIAGTGGVTGTRGYIAPEVAGGEAAGPAADIFGLAATAYAVLTGAPPAPGVAPTWGDLSERDAARVEAALAAGLSTDPAGRPATASALVEALRAPDSPTNLTPEPDAFIGRASAVAEVAALVRAERIVTLAGPGGIGKTRLALRVASDVARAFPDGVWLVELAPVADAGALDQVVARAVGAREVAGETTRATLLEHLREQTALVILDNCEQVVAAVADLGEALRAGAPRVHVLATSRELLGVSGEHVWQVPPLGDDSAVLFRERASRHGLDADGDVVERICERLDGLPLAIELAAARARTLPLDQIEARLGDRLELLRGGRRTADARQQTLRALVDWSYDLLDDAEREVFAGAGVFVGGIAPDMLAEVSGDEVLDVVERLTDKSLLSLRSGRYVMLETIREYALERLRVSGEEPGLRARHRDAFLGLAERAAPHLVTADQAEWFARLDAEHDNVRAALSMIAAEADGARAVRMTAAMWRYWDLRGHFTEGRRWLEVALNLSADETSDERARVLTYAGVLAHQQGDLAVAGARYEGALAVARAHGHRTSAADALHNLGTIAIMTGDPARAAALYDEALAIRRADGDPGRIADSLTNLGLLATDRGALDEARALLSECLGIYEQIGDRAGVADTLSNLALIDEAAGDLGRARDHHAKSLALRRELGDRWGIAASLANLGANARDLDAVEDAREFLAEALPIQRDLGAPDLIAFSLVVLATIAVAEGDRDEAVDALGEALALVENIGDEARTAECFEAVAALAGDAEAARLLATARVLRQSAGAPPSPADAARIAAIHARQGIASRGMVGTEVETGLSRAEALILAQTVLDRS